MQIVGDGLRDYHPDYQLLPATNDSTASAATDRDSGRWVEMAIAHALKHRYSVVIEGAMRDPQVPLNIAARFRVPGYRVEAWPLTRSRPVLGVVLRAPRVQGSSRVMHVEHSCGDSRLMHNAYWECLVSVAMRKPLQVDATQGLADMDAFPVRCRC